MLFMRLSAYSLLSTNYVHRYSTSFTGKTLPPEFRIYVFTAHGSEAARVIDAHPCYLSRNT